MRAREANLFFSLVRVFPTKQGDTPIKMVAWASFPSDLIKCQSEHKGMASFYLSLYHWLFRSTTRARHTICTDIWKKESEWILHVICPSHTNGLFISPSTDRRRAWSKLVDTASVDSVCQAWGMHSRPTWGYSFLSVRKCLHTQVSEILDYKNSYKRGPREVSKLTGDF